MRSPFARSRSLRPREPRRETPPAEPLTNCPRCSAPLKPDQDWCVQCGLAARTRLAPTPDWRIPLIAAVVAGLLGAGGLAFAFVELTADDGPVTTSTPTTTATTAPSTTTTETTGGTGAQP